MNIFAGPFHSFGYLTKSPKQDIINFGPLFLREPIARNRRKRVYSREDQRAQL